MKFSFFIQFIIDFHWSKHHEQLVFHDYESLEFWLFQGASFQKIFQKSFSAA